MPWDGHINIYSNDGNTLLSDFASSSGIIDVNEQGVYRPSSRFDDPLQGYTYSGTGTYLGVSTTPNTTVPELPIGTTGYSVTSIAIDYVASLYIVESGGAVTYKKLTYDSKKIQVESAIRDGNGVKIDTNYAKTSDLTLKQDTLVSGTNIKTINNTSLLGSGNITLPSSDVSVAQTGITTNGEYPILLKNTTGTSDVTAGVNYGKTTSKIPTINPSTGVVTAPFFAGTSNKAKGLIYLEPTVTTTGVLWTATSDDITAYYDGLMIAVKCPEATASGLTIKINSLTAPTVVYNATSAISTRYSQDSIIILTYKTVSGTAYWSIMDYDANTDTKVRQYQVTNNTAYSLLTRYNTTDKSGTYEATYTRFDTKALLNHSTGIIQSTAKYLNTSNNYYLLFGDIVRSASNASNVELLAKCINPNIYANPNTGNVQATTFNGYTLGAACEKAIGSIASGNTGLVTGGDVYTGLSGKQGTMTFTDVSITESD